VFIIWLATSNTSPAQASEAAESWASFTSKKTMEVRSLDGTLSDRD
jgi:hypothetical protein